MFRDNAVFYLGNFLVLPILRCLAVLFLVWLIIKLLPGVLRLVGLKDAVNDKTLVWLNTALIGFALIAAIVAPSIVFLAARFPM